MPATGAARPSDIFARSNDKRGKTLRLTEDGLAFAQPIIDPIRTIETTVIGAFGEQEMSSFIRQLQRLNSIIAEHTQEP